MNNRTIAVYYEHPTWFRPLFEELENRGLPYYEIRADQEVFDPAMLPDPSTLVLNRMSPSAWERGNDGAVFFTTHYLQHLEAHGVEVLNGADAFRLDVSKGAQMALLQRLGLPVPRTRIVYSAAQLPLAARSLEFPLLVKPNMGGNGAGIQRFDHIDDLEAAVEEGILVTGPDGIFLLQEYHPPKGGSIVRAETLEGRFLYGIRLHIGEMRSFSICPADVCSMVSGESLETNARRGKGNQATVEGFTPSPLVVREIERIAAAARMDVGGVEYLESERDGRRYYYDVNVLSNFIADPVKVVGFDPTAALVDSLEARVAMPLAA